MRVEVEASLVFLGFGVCGGPEEQDPVRVPGWGKKGLGGEFFGGGDEAVGGAEGVEVAEDLVGGGCGVGVGEGGVGCAVCGGQCRVC